MDPDFFPEIYGFPQSAEAGGLRVEVGPDLVRNVAFTRGSERYVYAPPEPLYCEDPVVSPDGAAAYLRCLRIQFRRTDGFGADYDSILRFQFGAYPLCEARSERILLPPELEAALAAKRAYITDLDRVSSRGRHLLFRVAMEVTARGRGFMRSRPYWYDLSTKALVEPDL
jgi:hypothetical protein